MVIYSPGRRRTMLILLLTSIMLITLDLRGNAIFDAMRTGFEYAFRPFEIAADVASRPVVRVWSGISKVDDLEAENERLRRELEAQRSDQIAWQNALSQNQELRRLNDLESLAAFDRVSASIIGGSPSNYDQRVEIDRGSTDGIKRGMPVTTAAGLVGRITEVYPTTSSVMLITDPDYHVPVKVIAEVAPPPPTTVPDTVPSGLAVEDVTTTTTSTTSTTSTTVPGGEAPAAGTESDESGPPPATTTSTTSTTSSTSSTSSTTTTTLVPPIEVTRETGLLDGLGPDRLPRVRFIADSPQFGRVEEGDAVLTAGGSNSLAPPDIPVGRIANVIRNEGTTGLELEVELNADLDRLNFLTVILFVPAIEAPAVR